MRARTMILAGGGAALLGATLLGGGQATLAADPPAAASAMLDASGPPVVRRLTESQYRATIADIFGPEIPIIGRFERGLRHEDLLAIGTSHAGLSPFSIEQYDVSAQGVAAAVLGPENRDKFVPCKPASEAGFDAACARRFIDKYGTALFRRPLDKDQAERFLGTARAAHQRLGGFYQGLQFTLAGMLVAPEFLLRIERSVPDAARRGAFRLDPYSKAERLSYFLTNSTPDEELLRAAAAGELDSAAGTARQVDRLISSPKYERAVRAFFDDLLQLDLFDELSKDPDVFPAYNSRVAADAQEQTLRTIVDLLVTQRGDYRDIFTTRQTFLTRPLGIVYRLPVATRNGWERAEFPARTGRSGILTNISFLALNAHPGMSSPTLRGKFIRHAFLCQHVPDPPADVDFSNFEGPKAVLPTARLRLDAHNENPVCAGCHKLTDPLGLALETFDGAGTLRTHENDTPIDVSGSLDGVDFAGAADLGKALRDNPQTTECLVQKLHQAAVGHEESPSDSYWQNLNTVFQEKGYRVPDLMRAIAVSPVFFTVSPRKPDPAAPRRVAAHSQNGDPS